MGCHRHQDSLNETTLSLIWSPPLEKFELMASRSGRSCSASEIFRAWTLQGVLAGLLASFHMIWASAASLSGVGDKPLEEARSPVHARPPASEIPVAVSVCSAGYCEGPVVVQGRGD